METPCEHCDAPVPAGDAALYRGHTYHPRCRKCFVCNETDLHDAEAFKGVIFCGACARRIFAERARRVRAPASPRARRSPVARVRLQRRTHRARLRELETQTVFYANTIPASVDVPSLDKIPARDTVDSGTKAAENKMASVLLPAPATQRHKPLETGDVASPTEAPREKRASTEHKSTPNNADAGLAELGASVELAQVTLRRPSGVTLVIKSGSAFNLHENKSLSRVFKPGTSLSQALSCCSQRPVLERLASFWRRNTLSSIMRMPFRMFKKNVLDKSSFISVYERAEQPRSPPSGLRDLFNDEISKHHRRGAQCLYSTIHRRSPPYRLGWVHAATFNTKRKRCPHYRASHSYRCLRAHVMRRAGPTRSELQQLRGRIKEVLRGDFIGHMLKEANLTNVRAG